MTGPKTLSYPDVFLQITNLMDGKRDYIYPARVINSQRSCRYWHKEDNAPGCIVGVWGYSLGLTGSDLERCENSPIITVVQQLERIGYTFEDRPYTVLFLHQLQYAQDSGATWGFSCDNACNLVDRQQEIDRLKAS